MFLSRPRIEVGASWKKLLMEGRNNSFGFDFAWQPPPIPLNVRAEYARSNYGSGYWIEGAYRFSQIPLWNKAMRRTEFVGRMQQFFAGEDQESAGDQYTLPHGATQQPDFGMNYYLIDGLKASASYGRWLGKHNWNVWTFGVAWRFALPLGGWGTDENKDGDSALFVNPDHGCLGRLIVAEGQQCRNTRGWERGRC
jgi:hypothetical protein